MNLTSIVVPHVVNKIKAVVEPRLFTATGMLNKNITSVMLESNNNIQYVSLSLLNQVPCLSVFRQLFPSLNN